MKGLIRKILKEESLKQNLKDHFKEFGWRDTAELIGGSKNLKKLLGIKTPMEFLNLFNDLEVVEGEDFIAFQRRKNEELMTYYKTHGDFYMDYDEIWLVLEKYFGLSDDEIDSIIKKWLAKIYNLKRVTSIDIYQV